VTTREERRALLAARAKVEAAWSATVAADDVLSRVVGTRNPATVRVRVSRTALTDAVLELSRQLDEKGGGR